MVGTETGEAGLTYLIVLAEFSGDDLATHGAKNRMYRVMEQSSDDTLASYLALLDCLYITEELPGWEPPLRSKAGVRVIPAAVLAREWAPYQTLLKRGGEGRDPLLLRRTLHVGRAAQWLRGPSPDVAR